MSLTLDSPLLKNAVDGEGTGSLKETPERSEAMSVVTPRIKLIGDRHWLMAGDILLVNITSKLPYEWSNMKILFDHKSTFEIRYGPFDRCRVRLEFDGDLIHWTDSCGWWHPRETTVNTDYKTTMRILFETGYDLWRKDNGIMDDTDKAIKLLNDSGIPAMRSSDSDCLIFEVGEQTFRALIPDNPTHTASLLADAAGKRGEIIAGYRKAVAGLKRTEVEENDETAWDELFSTGGPVEIGDISFGFHAADGMLVGLDLLIMSDGTWRPDGFDTGKEGAAGDVCDYLAQWSGGANHER